MSGWHKKILTIDLSKKKFEIIDPTPILYKKYIGGRGLAGHYLRPTINLDYDHPDMSLLLFTGPLTNTPSPTSGRMIMMSRSPETGTIGDALVGGTLGPAIKQAGFDGIIISGKSDKLCGIEINDGSIIFKNAESYKNRKVSDYHHELENKGSTLTTGPAADNNVLFASPVLNGTSAVGRGGLALVMAVKNLKYITVKGTKPTPIHDKKQLLHSCEDIMRLVSASPVLKGELGISHYGTAALYDLIATRRMMPTDNFRKTYFPQYKNLNAFVTSQKYSPVMSGCHGCDIKCRKATPAGRPLPDFESLSHFTALIENTSLTLATEANQLCNDLGMDPISTAATLACYHEIHKKELTPDTVLRLIEEIGYAKGIGNGLHLGASRYAQAEGKPEAAMTVKHLELPAYDPRGAYGMALAYATSTRGGCHLRAYPISHEILRKPVVTDRFTFSGKARIIKISESLNAAIDSITACKFIFFGASLEEYAKTYTAVTGIEITGQELLGIGERIYYNEKIMNAVNGFSCDDDDLPTRFFTEPGTSGNGIDIKPLDRDDFLETRSKYYKISGLDKNGIPTKEKATQLELEWN